MWFGIVISLAIVGGFIWWIVWQMKKDKEKG